jgi:hypothetical protein
MSVLKFLAVSTLFTVCVLVLYLAFLRTLDRITVQVTSTMRTMPSPNLWRALARHWRS